MRKAETRQAAGGMTAFLKTNAGKLGLAVVLLAVPVTASILWSPRGPSLKSKVQFVCVATGETFSLKGGSRILPRANPENGEKTLLPCHQGDDGDLYVISRCRSLVMELEKSGINKYVDPETLRVRREP
jgi:hypothetical protein